MRPEWPTESEWKKHWLLSQGCVFLNHGSFGACPKVVMEAQSKLRELMETAPLQFLWRRHDERLDQSRKSVADFLGADASNLVFVTNATTGVNAVLRSLEFQPGDEILTTDHDYNACRNVLEETARRSGARVVVAAIPFPLQDEEEIVAAILESVTPRTRLAMIDHVTSNTALVFPIERIIRELEALGVDMLVDGAHAPGMLPLELEKLRPAYYTGNLHKWTCAPKGSAFLWVRPDKQDAIQPAVISHGNNTPRAGHNPFQDRFDWAGTHDLTAWLCIPVVLEWLGNCLPGGWTALREHNHSMLLEARRMICNRLEMTPPCPEGLLGSMATLPLPGRLAESEGRFPIDPLYHRLADDHGIEMPVIHIHGKRWIRISAHLHNSPDEYRYLADCLGMLSARDHESCHHRRRPRRPQGGRSRGASGSPRDPVRFKASVGRKLLVAGRGGLNLTHGEAFDSFVERYTGPDQPDGFWRQVLTEFSPEDLRQWAEGLGIRTFQQRTGRVYPVEMKAAPLLRRWIERLRDLGVKI